MRVDATHHRDGPDLDSTAESLGEELANSFTHGIGALLSLAALTVLIIFASLEGGAWHVVGCAVFGTSLILLYTASTLYHSIPNKRARRVFQAFDHSAIFLLIAGTYTPFLLVNLRGPWGWSLLGAIWGIAVLGIGLRVSLRRRPHALFVALYVAMGWVALVAIRPIIALIPVGGLVLLIAGGVAYTLGVGFYLWRRLPYNHAVWHLFVLAGSALHFLAVLNYVIPHKV